ncbi:cation-transporting ATPase [Ligilactobacillus salitolerans]|uniref:Cation-transporting ATPase n=1 Tax=Ligilactobacillus salitolerans TaxID=1808352 RepID=A0A401IRU1_9LACO|nr:HAD-IC family P-type ATPase [Ligilactobacillus salitolerans]GBG94251.1 cation-transporting ATPase [Ligilactobacillus salitolerans]
MEHYRRRTSDLSQNYAEGLFENGLKNEDAKQRLAKDGPNKLESKRTPKWKIFLRQFDNMITYILIAAMAMTLLVGDQTDTLVIGLVVVINAFIGYFQESNAADALDRIQQMLALEATVYRDGMRLDIPAEELVKGDVVYLEAGDSVPADLRIVQDANLRIQESSLTGETDAVTKTADELSGAKVPLADQTNMAFTSTSVANGSGLGVVVATGNETEIGQISTAVAQAKPKETPMMKEIGNLGKGTSIGVLVVAVVLFILGFFLKIYSLPVLALSVVTMVVGSIPEGLPATTSVILALGVSDMARNKKTIVKTLPAVETLGAVDVIATDKTGTLTKNEMTLTDLITKQEHYTVTGTGYTPDGELMQAGQSVAPDLTVQTFLTAGFAANDTELDQDENGEYQINGEPTDGAFLTAYHKIMQTQEAPDYESLDMLPFDSEYRYIARLVRDGATGKKFLYTKGSPDKIFEMAAAAETDFDVEGWTETVEKLARSGKRVVAVGVAEVGTDVTEVSHELLQQGIQFLGLAGIIDPPRPEVIATLKQLNAAHVQVKMITGDSPITATAIGEKLGLADSISAITGPEWDELDEEGRKQAARQNQVFARTTPQNKLEIVEALEQSGMVTAMIGDGVNDAPALKTADIGVSMGVKGTDVARYAADMILTDDNFTTMGTAIREGRRIYDNIKKSILFLLPTSFAEGLIVFFSILLDMPLPLTPSELLWINMVSAITIQFAFIFEPAEIGIMHRRPRKNGQSMVNKHDVFQMIYVSIIIAGTGLLGHSWLLDQGASAAVASTLMVNIIIGGKIFYLFNIRTTHFALNKDIFSNKKAFAVIGIMLVLQVCLTYVPFMQDLFSTASVSIEAFIVSLLSGVVVFIIAELDKLVRKGLAKAR